MPFFKKNLLSRICCFALAIHLFNFSIDVRDNVPEDLSFNDIESIAEFLCEEVFGLDNAFEESDEADSDSETAISNCLKVFFVNTKLNDKTFFNAPLCIDYVIKNTLALDLFKSEITIPPPKVA